MCASHMRSAFLSLHFAQLFLFFVSVCVCLCVSVCVCVRQLKPAMYVQAMPGNAMQRKQRSEVRIGWPLVRNLMCESEIK